MVTRDLRRAIKARAMRYRIPTQILREQTIDGRDKTPKARIAWNFFTGLYFKGGGLPWAPFRLSKDTCYVGIGFFQHPGSRKHTIRTSLAQAFDDRGDGLVLRGHDFDWDPDKEGSRSPHLGEEQAAELVRMVLERYQQERKQLPRRLVVHKTSRFWPKEREGFIAALEGKVAHFDLVALEKQRDVRLITTSRYPPLRGTRLSLGGLDFLYTGGYISSLDEFHGMHIPSPIRFADHIGQDTPRRDILEEVLVLTKMNTNSSSFSSAMPITLEFSSLVGDILKELSDSDTALPQFKYYM